MQFWICGSHAEFQPALLILQSIFTSSSLFLFQLYEIRDSNFAVMHLRSKTPVLNLCWLSCNLSFRKSNSVWERKISSTWHHLHGAINRLIANCKTKCEWFYILRQSSGRREWWSLEAVTQSESNNCSAKTQKRLETEPRKYSQHLKECVIKNLPKRWAFFARSS